MTQFNSPPSDVAGVPCIQIHTTAASAAAAERVARGLVEARLAACVQVAGPLTSVYRWQDRIENAEEWKCTAKCRAADFQAVAEAIRRLHDYQTPEIIATPIAAGSPEYLDWLARETERRA